MRALLPVILCLFMTVHVIADDLVLGERQEDDYLVFKKEIKKPTLTDNPMTAKVLDARGLKNVVNTHVKVANVEESKTTSKLIKVLPLFPWFYY